MPITHGSRFLLDVLSFDGRDRAGINVTNFAQRLEQLRINLPPSVMAAKPVSIRFSDEKPTVRKPIALTARDPFDEVNRRQKEEVNAVRVKVLCNVFRFSAECVGSPHKFHPEWLRAESALYAERKREMIALSETIRDETLREEALERIVAFCAKANDFTETERLLPRIRSEEVRERVAQIAIDLAKQTSRSSSAPPLPYRRSAGSC